MNLQFLSMLIFLAVVLPAIAAEQEDNSSEKQPTNNKVGPSLQNLADETVLRLAHNAKTPEEHEAWRKQFKAKMLELLGHMPRRVPLDVKWAEKKEFDTFIRHKVYVRSTENYWVPAYYFVPKELGGKTPAIVCLHGHSGIYPYIREGNERDREKCKKLSLDIAPYLAEHGYITIAPVVRGWNETSLFKNKHSCRRITMDTFMIGMTPMGLRCWDASRLIDFLETQPEVDSERIGVGGLSGGGTLTMYMHILDDRVKLIMIGGAFSSYRASIYAIEHCICNCLPHVLEWGEMSDVVALNAPKPVLLINGINDPIFPIKQAREGYEKLKEIYTMLGVPENVDADFFDGPHAWSNNKTLSFLKKHFD